MDFDNPSTDETAARACDACKKYKRKCDKSLPSCSLCSRLKRACNYKESSENPDSTNSEDAVHLKARIEELENIVARISQHQISSVSSSSAQDTLEVSEDDSLSYSEAVRFFFLDTSTFDHLKLSVPSISIPTSQDVLTALGSWSDIAQSMSLYFQSVDTWIPVISKTKLSRLTEKSSPLPRADLALLLCCMKLLVEIPTEREIANEFLYTVVKQFSLKLESAGLMSLMLIQANLLIAVYELGHAILPAAYTSIARCARNGIALGIHTNSATQLLQNPRNWNDWEERQRIWWLIMILDRYITAGTELRPLCTEDPTKETMIPVNESAWEGGDRVSPERLFVSSPTSISVSPFARLAQASNLLGKVIRHCDDKSLNLNFILEDFVLLRQTTNSLLDHLLPTALDQCQSATAICFSTIMKLSDHHSCDSFAENNTSIDIEMTNRVRDCTEQAVKVLIETSLHIANFAHDLETHIQNSGFQKLSPLVLHCVYRAAITLTYMTAQTGNEEYRAGKLVCEGFLREANMRWRAAGTYLTLLRIAEKEFEREVY